MFSENYWNMVMSVLARYADMRLTEISLNEFEVQCYESFCRLMTSIADVQRMAQEEWMANHTKDKGDDDE